MPALSDARVPLLDARGLSFELPDGRALFTDLNLSLGAGLTALVGSNGVGKTTLARLLSGELSPTRGRVTRSGPVTYFLQREAPPAHSVGDYLGDNPWARVEDARLLADLLEGIADTALCPTLSGGQWMRVRLARLLTVSGAETLLLDEPTNDLDREGRRAVLGFLRHRAAGPAATVLISHDREALALCDTTLELTPRGLATYGGGYEAYRNAREGERARQARDLATAEKQRDQARAERQEQRERQAKRDRRGADAASKGGQAKILLGARKRAAQATAGKVDTETADKAAAAARDLRAALEALQVDPVMYAELQGNPLPARKLVAEASGFNLRFAGGEWLYPRDLDFAWRGNLRLALTGGNGSGKSTLLKCLTGTLQAETRGEFQRGPLTTLYLDQTGSRLDEDGSVFDNLRAVSGAPDAALRNRLAGFLFTGDAAFQPVRTLSGGERLRAAMAKGFFGTQAPELLLLDEPTNNLDLANIAFLEKIVADFRGAVIVVSHDACFLENCRLEEQFRL